MNYTAIEQRIFDMTADGLPHHREEMISCLNDKAKVCAANFNSLAVHIFHIRSKLRCFGQDLICERRRGGTYYRRVLLLPGTNVSEDPL